MGIAVLSEVSYSGKLMPYTSSRYHKEVCEPVPNGSTQFPTPSGPSVYIFENHCKRSKPEPSVAGNVTRDHLVSAHPSTPQNNVTPVSHHNSLLPMYIHLGVVKKT